MARVIFALLVVMAVVCLSEQRSYGQQCGGNEEFVTCGSQCEPSCSNPRAHLRPCTYGCKMGCQCRQGYLRNSIGACIAPDLC